MNPEIFRAMLPACMTASAGKHARSRMDAIRADTIVK
ncbi:MAG: hypothetical protein RLZ97_2540, partial [Verrucomicrobiota bacterium]